VTTDALRNMLTAINADRGALRHGAHLLRGIRGRLSSARLELTALQVLNGEFAGASMTRIALYWILFLVQLAVWPADVIAFGPVASFIAGQLMGQNHLVRVLAHLAIPLVIFSLDVVLGLLVMRAREQTGRAGGWGRLAALFVVALPLLVVATGYAVARVIHDAGVRVMLVIAFVWLAVVVGVLHLIFIYAAKLMHESRTYVVYAVRRRRLTRAVLAREKAEGRQIQTTGESLIELTHEVREYRAQTGDAPAIGPFDKITVEFIQQDFAPDPATWPKAGFDDLWAQSPPGP
jgi:heme exporter protein D